MTAVLEEAALRTRVVAEARRWIGTPYHRAPTSTASASIAACCW